MLKKFNLDSVYAGNEEVNGEHFMVEDVDDGPGAFRACLDVGLSRTSTGANVFGAMKGAADGGIEIPHSEKRFPGYDAEEKVRKTSTVRDKPPHNSLLTYTERLGSQSCV